MLLHGDHIAALFGPLGDAGGVNGLDGVDVDDRDVDALGLQQPGGRQRLADHQAAGKHGGVGALPQDVGLADLKGIILLEHGGGQTGQTHIGRTPELRQGQGGLPGLLGIGGNDDGHAGDQAHKTDVLDGLVAAAVLAHGHAGVGAADLHVELGIGDGVADLFIGPSCAEHSKRRAEGNQPHGRQACGDVHHVRLGNAAVEEALGIGGLEMLGHGGAGQVGVQHHHLLIGGAQLYQSLAVGFTGCDFFTHGLSPPIPSKPAGAAPRWGPCRASPPGSP